MRQLSDFVCDFKYLIKSFGKFDVSSVRLAELRLKNIWTPPCAPFRWRSQLPHFNLHLPPSSPMRRSPKLTQESKWFNVNDYHEVLYMFNIIPNIWYKCLISK